MTRIIAGTARGRRIIVPDGDTRPTSDRAREGIFSTIESLIGSLANKRVLDLFAGSGALGLEARSRGAIDVTLVDNSEKAIKACKNNIATLGFDGVVAVKMSADHFLRSGADNFDVILADPPYATSNSEIEELVALALARLAPLAVIGVERSTRTAAFSWPEGLQGLRERVYGEACIYYASPTAGSLLS
jgi:16S rRNA (guanine966-N2)-methyltransferase